MFNLKTTLVTASISALLILAGVSIRADGSKQIPDRTTSIQIDALDLMSKARDLPIQTIESAI